MPPDPQANVTFGKALWSHLRALLILLAVLVGGGYWASRHFGPPTDVDTMKEGGRKVVTTPATIEVDEAAAACRDPLLAAVKFIEACRVGVSAVHFGQGVGAGDDGDKYCRCVARTVRVEGLANADCEFPGMMDLRKFINTPFVELGCGEFRTF